MTKRTLAVLVLVPLLAGWIFFRRSAPKDGDYTCDTGGGRGTVTVRFVESGSVAAADELEAELAASGWRRAPVCTPTFRMMLRGSAVTALLAEDVGGRTRITMLQTRDDLW